MLGYLWWFEWGKVLLHLSMLLSSLRFHVSTIFLFPLRRHIVQDRRSWGRGAKGLEDLHFWAYFGVLAEIALWWPAWEIYGWPQLPSITIFRHFLCWAMTFMKLYFSLSDKAFTLVLGESDPKTIHKNIWCYFNSIFELDGEVVSLFLLQIETLTFSLLHKIQFENRMRGDADSDCLHLVDEDVLLQLHLCLWLCPWPSNRDHNHNNNHT